MVSEVARSSDTATMFLESLLFSSHTSDLIFFYKEKLRKSLIADNLTIAPVTFMIVFTQSYSWFTKLATDSPITNSFVLVCSLHRHSLLFSQFVQSNMSSENQLLLRRSTRIYSAGLRITFRRVFCETMPRCFGDLLSYV